MDRVPPRGVLAAVEGWGKTTIAAQAPKPLILMSEGETGYETLLGAGLVPDVDRAGPITSWEELLSTIDYLLANDTGHKSLWLDELGGFERLCHHHVGRRDFSGDMGPKGFLSFHKGYDMAVNDWCGLLQRLERLHREKHMSVWLLSHVQVRPFRNPLDEDYDRFVADCHGKTWKPTHGWADVVLFGRFEEIADKDKDGRVRGKGGWQRVIETQRRAAWDAKNRYGMPEQIEIPNDHTQNYKAISQALKGGKK